MTGPLFPVFLGIFCAMALLIAAYLLRRASRGFDPPRRPETRAERLADPAPMPGEIGDDTVTVFCACCDESAPWRDCSCMRDCGRRGCKWATRLWTRKDDRELAALLNAEGGA